MQPHPLRSPGIALVFAALVAAAAGACSRSESDEGPLRFRVVEAYLHDPNAFTQGLAVHDGVLYEGTGHYGRSTLRRVDVASGSVERLLPLESTYFGEGITILDGSIYQLTWQNGIAFEYDLDTFEQIATHRYEGEGWGLATDGRRLIMSDGSATLRIVDPDTFRVVRRITAHEADGTPVERLNELEYVRGEIWANIWYDERIVRLSPEDGEVIGYLDLSALYPRAERGNEDVVNGIALDADTGHVYVTGKNWPRLFELELRGR